MQQARSLFFPGNFLASGIGESWYTSGSGIYAFGEYLQTWYNPTTNSSEQILIADIPIVRFILIHFLFFIYLKFILII